MTWCYISLCSQCYSVAHVIITQQWNRFWGINCACMDSHATVEDNYQNESMLITDINRNWNNSFLLRSSVSINDIFHGNIPSSDVSKQQLDRITIIYTWLLTLLCSALGLDLIKKKYGFLPIYGKTVVKLCHLHNGDSYTKKTELNTIFSNWPWP